jgi:hypothetical protein
MKLFKDKTEKTEKTFSVKVKEVAGTIRLTIVDSETGKYIATLADISDDGIFLHRNVTGCLCAEDYSYSKEMFNSNDGSIYTYVGKCVTSEA